MRLWKRASGALKDQNSLWLSTLTRRSGLRNPDIEAAVIRATSHDESHVDYKNAQRVFSWARVSPSNLKPLLWAISTRMQRTCSWVVALKGLILIHGVFCCRIAALEKIGRLPFDLSSFKDGHSAPGKTWGHNAFVRAYYAFLDQKSAFLYLNAQERNKKQYNKITERQQQTPMMQELLTLQKLQSFLDMLLQIRPYSNDMIGFLILEAMDCVVIEIYDIYSRICNGVASVLMKVYSAGKVEATMALGVLQKATTQGEELAMYFEFCKDIGVINAADCPKVEQIPKEDIRELEHIINGVSEESNVNQRVTHVDKAIVVREVNSVPQEDKAIVVREVYSASQEDKAIVVRKDSESSLKTIITDNWEVFDEDFDRVNAETSFFTVGKYMKKSENPFASPLALPPPPVHGTKVDLPDLISF